MDLGIGRAWGEGQWAATAGLKTWPEVVSSDFYTWFGWHEVGRTDHGDGRVAVRLKPGGHQEAIDLVVALDAQQTVRLASLTLDRTWMDGGQTAKLADDLAQSFLLAFAQRHPEGPALAHAIFSLVRGSQPIIRAADPTAGRPSSPSTVVTAGLEAYRNEHQAVELMGPDVTILLDNWRDMDVVYAGPAGVGPGRRLAIEVLAALPPRPPFARTSPVLITGYPDSVARQVPPEPPTPRSFQPPFPVSPAPVPPAPPLQPPGPVQPYQPPSPASPPVVPPADRPYDALYLQATDLPDGMSMTQDSRGRGADPGDTAYVQFGGIDSGMTVWHGARTAPIVRLCDIRWVFPTPEAAGAYHYQAMGANSEGAAPVPNAQDVGSNCRVFGGKFEPLGPGTGISSYFYLFTVGRVVVKLFAADADGSGMRPDLLTPIAQNVVRRVSGALNESPSPAKKPWWRFW